MYLLFVYRLRLPLKSSRDVAGKRGHSHKLFSSARVPENEAAIANEG
jgi:hypothetical protein